MSTDQLIYLTTPLLAIYIFVRMMLDRSYYLLNSRNKSTRNYIGWWIGKNSEFLAITISANLLLILLFVLAGSFRWPFRVTVTLASAVFLCTLVLLGRYGRGRVRNHAAASSSLRREVKRFRSERVSAQSGRSHSLGGQFKRIWMSLLPSGTTGRGASVSGQFVRVWKSLLPSGTVGRSQSLGHQMKRLWTGFRPKDGAPQPALTTQTVAWWRKRKTSVRIFLGSTVILVLLVGVFLSGFEFPLWAVIAITAVFLLAIVALYLYDLKEEQRTSGGVRSISKIFTSRLKKIRISTRYFSGIIFSLVAIIMLYAGTVPVSPMVASLLILAAILLLVGSCLYAVIYEWKRYRKNPGRAFWKRWGKSKARKPVARVSERRR